METPRQRRVPPASRLRPLFFLLLLASLFAPYLSFAQTPDSTALADSTAPALTIGKVRFEGHAPFSRAEIDPRVRTRPNRRFLRIPGFTWWLWLHRLGTSGVFGERVSRALIATGEPPAYLDSTLLVADIERLELLYRQEGFRDAEVEVDVDTTRRRQLDVTFHIDTGAPTFVRRVAYDGLDMLSPEQQLQVARASLFRPERLDPDAPLTFRVADQRYSEPVLHEERRRLLTYLRDAGYAAVSRDSVRAIIYMPTPDSFDVTFRVRSGPRFRFAGIHFDVTGPEDRAARSDTLTVVAPDSLSPGGFVTARVEGDSRLSGALLTRTLQFQPGQWFDQSNVLATKRRLEGSGVFVLTSIEPLPYDTLAVDATPVVPYRIELQTRQRHQMRFETFMLQRNGFLETSDNELGTGLGVTYENANLLGAGEKFRLRTTGSIAADIDSTLFTSAQAEIATSLTYPYLIAPFRRLEQTLDLYDARTQLSLSFLSARRDELRLVVRGRGTARFRLEMQHTPTVASVVDLFDLSLSNPDTLTGFKADFLEPILGSVDDPVQQASIEEDYTQPQINNALRYTLRSARVNPLRREQGYSYETSFELGGNLPFLLDRFVYSPDTLEGSLPGITLFRGSGRDSRLIYRQYVRLTTDLRRYRPVTRNSVLAWKVIAGVAQPIGQADVVPLDRRFFSGGANSVRGWRLRDLGPGRSDPDTTRNDVANILGGDIKLETSIELRSTLLRHVLAADWIVAFFGDAGNVWFGPRNPGDAAGRFRVDRFLQEMGVGAGLGLRLAWEYLIVRLDLAYKVHDPALENGFSRAFESPRLHFGIGHAF